MNISQLQNELISQVRRTQDVVLLSRIKLLLEKNQTEKIYTTSSQERQKIEEAVKDYNEQNIFTSEEIFSEMDEWLKE